LGGGAGAGRRGAALFRPSPDQRGKIDGALDAALKAAIKQGGQTIAKQGDPEALLGSKPPYSQRYDAAAAVAAPLETASAVARLRAGRCEIWVASQAPEQTRRAVASALDISVEHVVLYPLAAGAASMPGSNAPMRWRPR
jgi:isoquinoline 1-oxidoreductase beta subunit